MKACSICNRDLTGKDDAVYSRHTGAYFCPVPDWPSCHDVEEKTFAARPSKRQAA